MKRKASLIKYLSFLLAFILLVSLLTGCISFELYELYQLGSQAVEDVKREQSKFIIEYDEKSDSYSVQKYIPEFTLRKTELEIPSTYDDGTHGKKAVTKIGKKAFEAYTVLTKITLPDTITEIGDRAFCGRQRVTSLRLPKNLTLFGESALIGLYDLQTIQLDGSNKVFTVSGNCLLRGTTLLAGTNRSVIPDKVTDIAENAFFRRYELTAVDFPNTIKSIGENAFMECALKEIVLPSGMRTVGVCAFWGCSYAKKIVLSDGIEFLGSGAFSNCHSVQSVCLPDSIKKIENGLFGNCTSLTEVTFGKNVEEIGRYAFGGTAVAQYTLPPTLKIIGESALGGTYTELELPSSVEKLGKFFALECQISFPERENWCATSKQEEWKNARGGFPVDIEQIFSDPTLRRTYNNTMYFYRRDAFGLRPNK